MEKQERTKYYPISLKDKKLHSEFMIFERKKGFQNVDETLAYLMSLEEKNEFLEHRCTLKEKDCLDLIDQKVELIARIEKLKGA